MGFVLLFQTIHNLIVGADDSGIPPVGFTVAIGIAVVPNIIRKTENHPVLFSGDKYIHIAASAITHRLCIDGLQRFTGSCIKGKGAVAVDDRPETGFLEEKSRGGVISAGQMKPLFAKLLCRFDHMIVVHRSVLPSVFS